MPDVPSSQAKPGAHPATLGSLVPYLMVSDANAASAFYRRAFGAEEVARLAMNQSATA